MTPANFDQKLLKEYSCGYAGVKDADCTDAWFAKAANKHMPSQDKMFTHSDKMLHYTIIFQVFVFLQIFNLINARKIAEGELNVFTGFFNNKMFIIVMILTILIQILLVEVGG